MTEKNSLWSASLYSGGQLKLQLVWHNVRASYFSFLCSVYPLITLFSSLFQDSIVQFVAFARQVESQAVASMKEDITYGDIPDEFRGQKCCNSSLIQVVSLVELHCTHFVPYFLTHFQGSE